MHARLCHSCKLLASAARLAPPGPVPLVALAASAAAISAAAICLTAAREASKGLQSPSSLFTALAAAVIGPALAPVAVALYGLAVRRQYLAADPDKIAAAFPASELSNYCSPLVECCSGAVTNLGMLLLHILAFAFVAVSLALFAATGAASALSYSGAAGWACGDVRDDLAHPLPEVLANATAALSLCRSASACPATALCAAVAQLHEGSADVSCFRLAANLHLAGAVLGSWPVRSERLAPPASGLDEACINLSSVADAADADLCGAGPDRPRASLAGLWRASQEVGAALRVVREEEVAAAAACAQLDELAEPLMRAASASLVLLLAAAVTRTALVRYHLWLSFWRSDTRRGALYSAGCDGLAIAVLAAGGLALVLGASEVEEALPWRPRYLGPATTACAVAIGGGWLSGLLVLLHGVRSRRRLGRAAAGDSDGQFAGLRASVRHLDRAAGRYRGGGGQGGGQGGGVCGRCSSCGRCGGCGGCSGCGGRDKALPRLLHAALVLVLVLCVAVLVLSASGLGLAVGGRIAADVIDSNAATLDAMLVPPRLAPWYEVADGRSHTKVEACAAHAAVSAAVDASGSSLSMACEFASLPARAVLASLPAVEETDDDDGSVAADVAYSVASGLSDSSSKTASSFGREARSAAAALNFDCAGLSAALRLGRRRCPSLPSNGSEPANSTAIAANGTAANASAAFADALVGALLEGRGVLLRLERVAVGAGVVGEAVQAPLARMTAGAALLVVGASLAFASFSRQRMLELVERHKEAWRNPPAPVPVYDRYDSNSGRLGRPGLIRGSSSLGRSSSFDAFFDCSFSAASRQPSCANLVQIGELTGSKPSLYV
ncbi:hypothetical protein EMIHUDRAFT_102171 [Emiliania huxleyi CCMP1516]|uniref:Uncharacterized protein n=2 Tax=Emiliania huxleyi TaxID=2903 RepID=A0A0D3J7M9_EMIH1|nr:hypothetical protein EMIHUDRAFT_102171 [Emiliania huxleyi CCMP1516]EOD19514.1 hypothetical protein EMIHUDRAFT_102171 [Emiliania huxleyi CCMP1516]|eukprot:XP_005771943.1 hypothetical protein EMIHUDRAFT_102171 [Emiliania huxleyi CCMP1516]